MISHRRLHDRRAILRSSQTVIRHAIKALVEQLEKRQLLTTVHGGDTIEFQTYGPDNAASGEIVRMVVDGPSTAQFDLIGATSAPDATAANFGQTFTLNDIPSEIQTANGQNIEELGGVGGADGVNPIGTVTGGNSVTDLITAGGGIVRAPSAGITFSALSSNSKGVTWGLNLVSVEGSTPSKMLELANFDYRNSADATVYADLAPRIVQLTGAKDTTSIQSVIACDFLPTNDNLLYIGVVVNVPRFNFIGTSTTPTDSPIPFLFVYNFNTPGGVNNALQFANPNQPEFESQSVPGPSFADLAPTIHGFSFADDDSMVAYVDARDVTGTGSNTAITTTSGIVNIPDPNNPIFGGANPQTSPVIPVTLDNAPISPLYGLEVVPGDDQFVYAIFGTGAASELVHVTRFGANAGVAIDYGPLPDPQDNRAVKRGENLGDLDWNPVLVNPFHDPSVTGKKGLLMSEDFVTDELVVIDQRDRYPETNLYAIYGTNTTPDTSLSVAVVPALNATPRPMEPFTGNVGSIRINNAQTGTLTLEQNDSGATGAVLIGALTRNLIPDTINDHEDLIPIRRILKKPSQKFGNLPIKTKYVYAGITIEGSMHNLLVGGTVTGNFDLEGNADLVYAGDWLTGDADGVLQTDDLNNTINGTDVIDNVFIHGDMRTFASGSSFGSFSDAGLDTPDYLTGFDMNVGGKLGQITAPGGSFMGAVADSNTFTGSSATQQEVEDKRGPTSGDQTYFQGFNAGDAPSLGDTTLFDNDTFQTAQYLSTAQNNALGSDQVAVVNGSITNDPTIPDPVDYYAVALLAGQSVTVQLSSSELQSALPANVGVFDPDDRLIASDRADEGLAANQLQTKNYVSGQPFRFTADRPGTYRFAIGFEDDSDFTGTTASTGLVKYTLMLTGLDKLALGGVVAGANVFTWEPGIPAISVHTGDLGAVTAGAAIFDDDIVGTGGTNIGGSTLTNAPSDAYLISRGNFRSLEAPTVGLGSGGSFGDSVNFLVPRGSVGLTRATGTDQSADVLLVNMALPVVGANGLPDPDFAVGGQWQLADSEAEFASNISADGPIGTIRAATMTVIEPSTFIANADRSGSDGTIDLIDVAGDMGTSVAGGPNIFTGPGGNVRYMRAGGLVFNSRKYDGGGIDLPVIYDPGQSVKLTDDSGTPIKITPTPQVVNPDYDPTDGIPADASQYLNPGQLAVQTYSTADATKGGVVIMKVQVDSNELGTGDSVTGGGFTDITGNHGIDFDSGASGNLASVEIGEVDTFATSGSRAITEIDPGQTITNPDGTTTTNDSKQPELVVPTSPDNVADETTPDDTTPINLTFHGDSRIDVWSIVGRVKQTSIDDSTTTSVASVAAGPIDQINNDTDGEIVNVDASSVADIAAQWVGIARSHTGVDKSNAANAVNGVTILDDGGSGSGTTGGTGNNLTGGNTTPFVQQRNLIHIHGDPTSYLVTVHARKGVGNIWVEGIIGDIVADSNGHPDPGGGFEGIDGPIVATPGASDTAWDARIEDVDIGQGIAYGGSGDVPFAGIFGGDTIGAVHGEGVDHDIYGIIHAGSNFGTAFSPIDDATIGSITLDGGSIINADIGITGNFDNWRNSKGALSYVKLGDTINTPIYQIGDISIKGTGGIIGTLMIAQDVGPIKINGGFGFINSELDSLATNDIVGVDTTGYGIRGSEFFGGANLQELVARGTGKAISAKSFEPSVLTSAVDGINPFTGREPDQLTDLYRALGLTPKHPKKKSISASGVIENVLANGGLNLGKVSAYEIRGRNGGDTEFDFSNSIGTIAVSGGTDEFTLNTGGLNKFTTGDDVSNTTIGVAGPIGEVNVGGTLRGTSQILATGPNGTISSLHTKHALYGMVNATIGIGTISVGTDLGSPNVATIGNLDLLEVTGSILDGAVVANIKKNQFIPIRKIVDLEVGGDVQKGALIRAKAIDKEHVGGNIDGNIIVGAS